MGTWNLTLRTYDVLLGHEYWSGGLLLLAGIHGWSRPRVLVHARHDPTGKVERNKKIPQKIVKYNRNEAKWTN